MYQPLRRVLVVLISSGLLVLSPGTQQWVLAQTQPDGTSQTIAQLQRLLELTESLRGTVDHSQFDSKALALDLAFEQPPTIVSWVRRNIGFEPYAGLLRGADGTLMGRAGNALDQSVLLASLLNDAGYEARIARGALSLEQVDRLLEGLGDAKPFEEPFADMETIRAILGELAAQSALPQEDVTAILEILDDPPVLEEQPAYQAVQADTDFVLRALADADLSFHADAMVQAIRSEAQDYYWVEHRMHSDEPWSEAHPALADGLEPFTGIQVIERYEGSVPEHLQHRVRLEVFVEQRLGSELVSHPVMPAWERPAANLNGIPFSYSNAADSLGTPEAYLDPMQALESAQTFAPMLNGALPAGGMVFDLNGSVVDAEAASAPAAGVFREVGSAFGEAAGAVAGEEAPDEYVTITGQWLEFTFVTPGGAERTVRRAIFDRLGDQAREDGNVELQPFAKADIVRQLVQRRTFMVATSQFANGFIFDRLLSGLAQYTEVALAHVESRDQGQTLGALTQQAEHLQWLGHYTLYPAFDRSLQDDEGLESYRSAPNLVINHEDMLPMDGAQRAIDIVSNSKRTLQWSDGRLEALPRAHVRRGVWETHMERILPSGSSTQSFNVSTHMAAAQEHGVPITTIGPGERENLAGLSLPDAAKAWIDRDLEAGYAVVVPERTVPGHDLTAWWRVHLTSGEALGVASNGFGIQLTENQIILVGIAGTMMGVAAFVICQVNLTGAPADDGSSKYDLSTIGTCISGASAAGTFGTAGAVAVFAGLTLVTGAALFFSAIFLVGWGVSAYASGME